MLDVTDQLQRYGAAVAETVEPVHATDVIGMTTDSHRPRRPVWQPLAAAAAVVLLAGGVWLATRPSDPADVRAGTRKIEVGVATVLIPDGMQLDQLEHVDEPASSPVTGSDGSAFPPAVNRRGRARLSTAVGTCTITSGRGHLGVERYTAELLLLAELRSELEVRIADLDRQIGAAPPDSELVSLVSQREVAVEQLDDANRQGFALREAGPQLVPTNEGFTPSDASRTIWSAQATLTDVVSITCPDRATAQELVDATTLPTPTP